MDGCLQSYLYMNDELVKAGLGLFQVSCQLHRIIINSPDRCMSCPQLGHSNTPFCLVRHVYCNVSVVVTILYLGTALFKDTIPHPRFPRA
jgi:hypothetical protein